MTTTEREGYCGSIVAVACVLFPFGIAATPNAQARQWFDRWRKNVFFRALLKLVETA
jgi:hypothetical protein